ncbi:MAG: hypothetical protein ABFC96_16385 [Thermoguttaceae bacterium]
MRRAVSWAFLSVLALIALGCSSRDPRPTGRPSTPPPAAVPTAAKPAPATTPTVEGSGSKPVEPSSAAAAPSSAAQQTPPALAPAPAAPAVAPPQPASTAASSVALSTAVALPQTGPDGTMMMFSVDYEVSGQPAAEGYVWVIERAHGEAAKVRVALKNKGNLVAPPMTKGWRPEDAPFHCHLEDLRGNRVSESIEMPVTGG